MERSDLWRDFQRLSPAAQRQVADFIAFLLARSGPSWTVNESSRSNLLDEPFVGLWRDREEMSDSSTWVRKVRRDEWAG